MGNYSCKKQILIVAHQEIPAGNILNSALFILIIVINIIQNLSTSYVRYFSFAFGVYRKNRSPSRGKIIAENLQSRAGKLLGFPFTRYSVL